MAFCEKCGSELSEGSAFCPKCGAPARAEATQAATVPPPPSAATPPPPREAAPPAAGMQPSYQPPPATPAPGYYQPAGGKKGGGGKAVLFGGLGLLVVGAIVVLLLGFAVGPKWFTGGEGGGKGGPEEVAANFLKAMENKDAKLLKSTIAPSSLEYLESMLSYGDYGSIDEFFEDMFFSTYKSMKFSGVKYKTTMEGDDKATVEIVEGKVTVVDESGTESTEDVKDAETPAELQMVKEGDKWYLDMMNM
ncbi:MAG: zinc ribbon domain-containing protein [Actinobacteria bacterium]|nr:zinc ribbon domain-containing protein [Actinomycetota bacterium]